jgi:RimJ/RimL family protein N-acetyltransferase
LHLVEIVSILYALLWLPSDTQKESFMAMHTGPSYCQHDICIGTADLAHIATLPKALDIRDSVSFYLDAAPLRSDIYYFCIYYHATPVGQIILHDIDWQTGESLIGYHLFLPEYRGRGIGTSALTLLQRHVCSMTNLTRLIIITSRDNQASQRIAIKCGFEFIGPGREDPDQLLVFGWDVPQNLTS